jgi:hypothetical protein
MNSGEENKRMNYGLVGALGGPTSAPSTPLLDSIAQCQQARLCDGCGGTRRVRARIQFTDRRPCEEREIDCPLCSSSPTPERHEPR